MPAATLAAFQRDYKLSVAGSYLAALVGGVGAGIYVAPLFTGTAAAYSDLHPEWEFWAEPAGLVSAVGLIVAMISLKRAWACLTFRGNPGEGLQREGQGVITRSMTISGLTIVGVLASWVVRGIS